MASAPTITPKKRSTREWNDLLTQENSTAREKIIPTLASFLSRKYPGQWIPVVDLFEESAMHGLVHRHVLGKSLFSGSFFQSSDGTEAYKVGEDRSILLRHKFGNQWFVLGCRRDRTLLDGLAEYIKKVMLPGNIPGPGTTVSEQILGDVLKFVSPTVSAALSRVSEFKNLRKAETTLAVVTPGSGRKSRSDVLTTALQHAPKPLAALRLLTEKQQEAVMQKLTRGYKMANVYEDAVGVAQEKGNAVALLQLFKGDISRQALVERLLNSKEVQDSGRVFPRTFDFDSQCETGQSNAINVIVGVAIGAAKAILPGDADEGAKALLKRMTENKAFKRFALPNLDLDDDGDSKESYLEFQKNPVVLAIKAALEKLGTSDQKLRVSLASLLAMYPQDWVTGFVDKLGRKTMSDAKDHAKAVGAGLRPEFETPVTRNRRCGPQEDYLQEWLDRAEDVEHAPRSNVSGQESL
jgi:hypothetical protein